MNRLFSKVWLVGIVVFTAVVSLQSVVWGADFERHDVTFKSRGLNCAGWYYLPKELNREEKRPAIVMAHGYSLVKEMGLEKFAEQFAEAGFVVLVFDYRYLGASEGEPRGQIFYFEQQQDYRNAITWISTQKEVDPQRIGIWGTSYSGGHVLHLGAFDKRVKAVVSQVPAADSWETNYQNVKPEEMARRWQRFAENRIKQYTTGEVSYIPVVAPNGQRSIMPRKDACEFFMEAAKNAPTWENRVTLESIDVGKEYRPVVNIDLISPTPLLMIIASDDTLCPTESQKRGFERAGEPKKLVILKGDHFAVYQDPGFIEASTAAVEWFKQYLKQ